MSYTSVVVSVYPYTGSGTKTIVIRQDPKNPNSIPLPLSENQLTGIEFSYSSFIYISDDTDDGTAGWKNIFYKGYESGPFPLCGPGVFVNTASNTLRIIMNTYDKWFNVVDVPQIPFNKWFHLVISVRNNTLEIYINGNLANKKSFAGTLPYQNYGPLVLFSNTKTNPNTFAIKTTETSSYYGIPPGEDFVIKGKFSGYISNLMYYSYALSYSEIQGGLNVGPSKNFDQSSMDRPPYLIDSWWTSRGNK